MAAIDRHANGGRTAAVMVAIAALAAGACGGDAQSNKARVAEYLDTFLVDRDWAAWPRYFAADASINGSGFALQIMRGTAEGLAYSFADLELEIVAQVEEGDRVATAFSIRGRHVQPFNAQPATGQVVTLDGFVIDRFDAGRIVDSTMMLDVLSLSRRVASGAAARPPGN
jgi:predicted ester cyclase